jgi:hypothetical protein
MSNTREKNVKRKCKEDEKTCRTENWREDVETFMNGRIAEGY